MLIWRKWNIVNSSQISWNFPYTFLEIASLCFFCHGYLNNKVMAIIFLSPTLLNFYLNTVFLQITIYFLSINRRNILFIRLYKQWIKKHSLNKLFLTPPPPHRAIYHPSKTDWDLLGALKKWGLSRVVHSVPINNYSRCLDYLKSTT